MRSAGIVGILQPFVFVLMVLLCSTFTLSATANAQGITQLSGTVVDASGAVIAGATVQVRSANGILQKTTQTDANGSFIISGLAAGNYRLVISNPGLETKEIPVTIATTESRARLRISLAVGSVSTTINVQGREDSLIGIAESASQGTVGAAEIQDRPILRSGEILETIPGMIITQHAGGGKANQYFLRGFNLDHGTDFAIFLDGMPLNLPSHAHGEGYADMNTVIPEFVERLNYEKGPYYADVGNYGSVGSAEFGVFQDPARELRSRSKAACMASGGPFSAYRKSSVRAICCMAERRITITAHATHPDNYYKFNGIANLQPGRRGQRFQLHGPRLPGNVELERSNPRYRHTSGWFLWRAEPDGRWRVSSVIACRANGIAERKFRDKSHGLRILL